MCKRDIVFRFFLVIVFNIPFLLEAGLAVARKVF